ncbi:unnamed protein product [Ascophyllum nodosum]
MRPFERTHQHRSTLVFRHQDPRSKVEVGRSRPSLSSLDLVSHKINV